MINIFENAKFGDRFKTRDGRMAIYLYERGEKHYLIVDTTKNPCPYRCNGKLDLYRQSIFDIVSSFRNPISKAELDQKAWDRAYERFLEDTKHRLGYAIGYQDGWNEAIEYINPKKK